MENSPITPHEPSWRERMQGEKVKVPKIPKMISLEQIKLDGRRWTTDTAEVIAYEMIKPNNLASLFGMQIYQHQWLCRTPRGRFFLLLATATAKKGWDVMGSEEVEWNWNGANINPIETEWAMGAWFDMTVKVEQEFGEAFPGRTLEDA